MDTQDLSFLAPQMPRSGYTIAFREGFWRICHRSGIGTLTLVDTDSSNGGRWLFQPRYPTDLGPREGLDPIDIRLEGPEIRRYKDGVICGVYYKVYGLPTTIRSGCPLLLASGNPQRGALPMIGDATSFPNVRRFIMEVYVARQ